MKKNLCFITIVIFIVAALFSGVKIQSVSDYYSLHPDEIRPDSQTVFLSIRCDTILNNWNELDKALQSEKYVPKNGIILAKTQYVLHSGDSVFEILNKAVKANNIPLSCVFSNNYNSVYVQGINHLFEFSCGALSGWMYKVNGDFPNYGCSAYKLKDGDVIEWQYTCDLGRDVGNTDNW